MRNRKVFLWAAGLAFGALWIRRMVEWWGDPAAMIAFSIPPIGAFLILYLFTRERVPGRVSPLPDAIRNRSRFIDAGLLVSLALLGVFYPEAAIFYGTILTAAAAYWAGYCRGRVDAETARAEK